MQRKNRPIPDAPTSLHEHRTITTPPPRVLPPLIPRTPHRLPMLLLQSIPSRIRLDTPPAINRTVTLARTKSIERTAVLDDLELGV